MVQVRVPLTRLLRPYVRRYQLVVARVELHTLASAPYAYGLPNEPERNRVEALLEDHVTVTGDGRLLPQRQVVGAWREGFERGPLDGLKLNERLREGGAVFAQAGGGKAPGAHVGIGLRQQGGRAAAEEIAFDVVDAALLDLALVLGRAHAAGGDEKAVVLGTLTIALLDERVIAQRADDGSLEIVTDDALGNAAEEGEGVDVEPDPGCDGLVEHELNVLVAAPGKGHDKDPGGAQETGQGVDELAGSAEVDLSFLTGVTLDPNRGVRRARLEVAHEAVDGVIGADEALLAQALVNGSDFDLLLAQRDDEVTIGLDRGDGLRGRGRGQGALDKGLELLERRHGGVAKQGMLLSPGTIALDGLAMNAKRARDGPIAGRRAQMTKKLPNVHEIFSPASHTLSPLDELLGTGYGRTGSYGLSGTLLLQVAGTLLLQALGTV